MIRFTEMSELDGLRSEKLKLVAEIAACSTSEATKAPGKKGAEKPSMRIDALNLQLAALNTKLNLAEARAAKG